MRARASKLPRQGRIVHARVALAPLEKERRIDLGQISDGQTHDASINGSQETANVDHMNRANHGAINLHSRLYGQLVLLSRRFVSSLFLSLSLPSFFRFSLVFFALTSLFGLAFHVSSKRNDGRVAMRRDLDFAAVRSTTSLRRSIPI